jgi:hypothetical protein
VAEASHKSEGHRVGKVGADDPNRRHCAWCAASRLCRETPSNPADRVLQPADRVLQLAFRLVGLAFGLQPGVAHHLAGGLPDRALGLLGG